MTDGLEITMRTDKNNRAKINRMLRSGTQVEVVEEDRATGYSRVRTGSGAEGWVLSRYLLKRPPARVTLPDIERRLQQSDKARAELEASNRTLKQENTALAQQMRQAEGTLDGLEKDLSDIRSLSSNAMQIDAQNKDLRRRLTETERLLAELEDENRKLSGQSSREWFIVGAGVVIFGMLLGLIVPRIRWRRKSSWGDF